MKEFEDTSLRRIGEKVKLYEQKLDWESDQLWMRLEKKKSNKKWFYWSSAAASISFLVFFWLLPKYQISPPEKDNTAAIEINKSKNELKSSNLLIPQKKIVFHEKIPSTTIDFKNELAEKDLEVDLNRKEFGELTKITKINKIQIPLDKIKNLEMVAGEVNGSNREARTLILDLRDNSKNFEKRTLLGKLLKEIHRFNTTGQFDWEKVNDKQNQLFTKNNTKKKH